MYNFINDASKRYNENYSGIFNQLINNLDNIRLVDNFENYPLIQCLEDQIVLWHQVDSVSPHPHVFSDINEISFLVRQTIFDNSYVYILKKTPLSFKKRFN